MAAKKGGKPSGKSEATTPGYYLHQGMPGSRHTLAGARASYPEVRFPECPGCGFLYSPALCLDFDDPLLASLGIWNGKIILFMCHNGCERTWSDGIDDVTSAGSIAWDYSDARAPRLLDPSSIESNSGATNFGRVRNWEYQRIDLRLEPRTARSEDEADTATRIGGEGARVALGFDEATMEAVPLVAEVACPKCRKTTRMLAQMSAFEVLPEGSPTEIDGEEQLENPSLRSWFGCAGCHIVVTVGQFD